MTTWNRRWAREATGPCQSYTAKLKPCKRRANGYGKANTGACWQHQLDLKRWQRAMAQRGATA